ncbi:MAG: DUF262 domain-containing protein [Polyangia bacterium]
MPTTTKAIPEIVDQLADERRLVDFDTYDISVQEIISMVNQDQIDIAPTYQRRFRWDVPRQSQFVESIFLGIPIPSLFMATNSDGTWEVVDGVQRLSTLAHFAGDDAARRALSIDGPLQLEGLEKLGAMNGLTFLGLPTSVQTQFKLRPIKITTLSDKSDKKVRFDLFERLNTGGVKLTDQEIRGCIFRGQFNDFLERMAGTPDFNRVVVLKKAMESDGTREEYVLRFFAYLHRYKDFEHSVVTFLNDFMALASKSFDFARGEKEFLKTFSELARVFPKGISRRTRLTPVNLFEAVAVGAALALRSRRTLVGHGLSTWISSAQLKAMTTAATNNRKMVVGRIEFAARHFGAP